MSSLIIAAMHPESVRSFWSVVAVVAIGMMALAPFSRRIGGAGGGAEKAIVGAIWVAAAVSLGFFMFHGA
ncbi:hypothetical protein K1T35_42260 [Pseudonocardia sp. DSM 110487]|uniref:hypothetical protein n=1 Tax=Pseudonocardia sp. DSM 110487 TaxID=2865833 RepID=UPI001C6A162D|nr:hypothetical protein [Pseudonocardia sp. DSM 110487]QYN34912.1 hypothetical protein K1T35_42260 [Pseudonocardia sp. DSM 110487]